MSTQRIGLAVLTITAALASAGCASGGPAGAAAPSASAADVAAGTALYDSLSTTIYGTPTDRVAAEKMMTAKMQQAIVDCMKERAASTCRPPTKAAPADRPHPAGSRSPRHSVTHSASPRNVSRSHRPTSPHRPAWTS